MLDLKFLLHNRPVGIALVLELAIANIAVEIAPSVARDLPENKKPSLDFLHEYAISPHPLTPSPKLERRGTNFKVPLPELGEGFRVRAGIDAGSLTSNVDGTQLAQSNPPPPPTNPGRSSAGGRRDPSNCPQDAEAAPNSLLLTALSPTTKPGLTLADRPTFLVYVPKTSAKNAEFSLRSRDGRGVYRTTVALTNTPNLITLSLPVQTSPLAVGQIYTWSFAIICNPNDRLSDRFVTGTVQRIALDPTRLRQIQQASPKEQVMLYQKADIWYDALALLFQLKRSPVNDPSIGGAWRELLQAGGVDTLIDINPEKGNPR